MAIGKNPFGMKTKYSRHWARGPPLQSPFTLYQRRLVGYQRYEGI